LSGVDADRSNVSRRELNQHHRSGDRHDRRNPQGSADLPQGALRGVGFDCVSEALGVGGSWWRARRGRGCLGAHCVRRNRGARATAPASDPARWRSTARGESPDSPPLRTRGRAVDQRDTGAPATILSRTEAWLSGALEGTARLSSCRLGARICGREYGATRTSHQTGRASWPLVRLSRVGRRRAQPSRQR